MNKKTDTPIPKWPFLTGDIILVSLACFIVISSPKPLTPLAIFACALSIILGMLIYVTPYLLEHLTQQQRIRLRQSKAEESLLSAAENTDALLNRSEEILSEFTKGILLAKQIPGKLQEKSAALTEVIESESLIQKIKELKVVVSKLEAVQTSLTNNESPYEPKETQSTVKTLIKELSEEISTKLETQTLLIKNLQPSIEDSSSKEIAKEVAPEDDEINTIDPEIFDDQNLQNEEDEDYPDAEIGGKSKKDKNHKNIDGATRLVVSAFIGISNKLYVRGEGPGLSWDKGIPMELVGIGKWEWKTYEAVTTVRCKILINDEQWTDAEDFSIEPNTTIETTASF